MRRIEEHLGFFYVAFWKIKVEDAVNTIVTVCRERFNWDVSVNDFEVVQSLECKRAGVLLRVSSMLLRDKILKSSHLFLREGFHVSRD